MISLQLFLQYTTGEFQTIENNKSISLNKPFFLHFNKKFNESDEFCWNISIIHNETDELSSLQEYTSMFTLDSINEGPIYLKNSTIIVEHIFDGIASTELAIIYTASFCLVVTVIGFLVMKFSCSKTHKLPDEKALINNEEETSDSYYDQPYQTTTKFIPQSYLSHITQTGSKRFTTDGNSVSTPTLGNNS